MSGPKRPTSDDGQPDGSEEVTVVVPRPGADDETTVVVQRPDRPAAEPDAAEPANPWYVEHRHDNPEQTAPAEQPAQAAPSAEPPPPDAADPWATALSVPVGSAQPVPPARPRSVPPMPPMPPPVSPAAAAPAAPPAPAKRGKGRLVLAAVAAVVLIGALGAGAVLLLRDGGFGGGPKELDINAAQSGVQQVLTDPINGYGRDEVTDVHCHDGKNIPVKAGTDFTCTVKVSGEPRQVKVQFLDENGTYEIDRPTPVN